MSVLTKFHTTLCHFLRAVIFGTGIDSKMGRKERWGFGFGYCCVPVMVMLKLKLVIPVTLDETERVRSAETDVPALST
jgi:hypothetical protein